MAASQTTAATNPLPTRPEPTSHGAAGLLVYDGDCGFCTRAARWFDDLVGESAAIAPWQSLDLGAHGLTEAQASTAAYWLHDGESFRGADCFAHALQACTGGWHYVGRLLAMPPIIWITRAIYPLIAKYRYRLPGSTNACRLD